MVTLDQAGRARAWTRISPPQPALEPFVELLWTQPRPPPGMPEPTGWRIVPDASPHLVVARLGPAPEDPSGSGSFTRATLVGARRHHVDSDMPSRAWTAGVRFRPGVIGRLAGLPASEFADRAVTVADVFGSRGERLAADLDDAADAGQALAMIQAMLVVALADLPPPDRRIAGLVRCVGDDRRAGGPDPGVRSIAARLGVAERTLRHLCAAGIGLSPVRVVRVARLHRALGLALSGAPRDWARIAARTGYFDQSHMIREFGSLLGETPRRFLARR